jgi:hypothetical protein
MKKIEFAAESIEIIAGNGGRMVERISPLQNPPQQPLCHRSPAF